MSTLAELKTRIILDTNRDDMGAGGELEQALADAIADAIEFHAGTLFWFNRASGTSPMRCRICESASSSRAICPSACFAKADARSGRAALSASRTFSTIRIAFGALSQ